VLRCGVDAVEYGCEDAVEADGLLEGHRGGREGWEKGVGGAGDGVVPERSGWWEWSCFPACLAEGATE
jgi:hypothetical protein